MNRDQQTLEEIILNKSRPNYKRVVLAIAILSLILIVVIVSSLSVNNKTSFDERNIYDRNHLSADSSISRSLNIEINSINVQTVVNSKSFAEYINKYNTEEDIKKFKSFLRKNS